MQTPKRQFQKPKRQIQTPKSLAVLHRAIPNPHHAIWNRCDLKSLRFGRLRCQSVSKTIKIHSFLCAHGSKRYFPALIRSAKNYTFHRVVEFLLYCSCVFMISGPQRQLRERETQESCERDVQASFEGVAGEREELSFLSPPIRRPPSIDCPP